MLNSTLHAVEKSLRTNVWCCKGIEVHGCDAFKELALEQDSHKISPDEAPHAVPADREPSYFAAFVLDLLHFLVHLTRADELVRHSSNES